MPRGKKAKSDTFDDAARERLEEEDQEAQLEEQYPANEIVIQPEKQEIPKLQEKNVDTKDKLHLATMSVKTTESRYAERRELKTKKIGLLMKPSVYELFSNAAKTRGLSIGEAAEIAMLAFCKQGEGR